MKSAGTTSISIALRSFVVAILGLVSRFILCIRGAKTHVLPHLLGRKTPCSVSWAQQKETPNIVTAAR